MRPIGRIAAVAATGVLALGMTACQTSSSTTSESKTDTQSAQSETTTKAEAGSLGECDAPKGDGSQTIYLVSKGFQHRFWQAVKEGAEEAGTACGYKVQFVGPDDETKVTQQLDQLNAAVDSNPAAIGFAALDSGAAAPILEIIKSKGIPVIAFDSGVDSDIPLTTVQTDNAAAAAEAAKHLVEAIGGKGKVALICHDQTSQTGKARCTGFQDYIKKNAPDVTLLEPQYAGEVGKAADTAKAIIQANDDLAGIYGTNEAAATGAVQGAAEAGKADLKVVGFDSGKTQLAAIKAGTELGAVSQAPKLIGFKTVEAAVKALNKQELPKIIDSGFYWFDKSNMEDPTIAPNLYE